MGSVYYSASFWAHIALYKPGIILITTIRTRCMLCSLGLTHITEAILNTKAHPWQGRDTTGNILGTIVCLFQGSLCQLPEQLRVHSPKRGARKLETNQIASVFSSNQKSNYYWLQLKIKSMHLSTLKFTTLGVSIDSKWQDVHTGSLNPNAT